MWRPYCTSPLPNYPRRPIPAVHPPHGFPRPVNPRPSTSPRVHRRRCRPPITPLLLLLRSTDTPSARARINTATRTHAHAHAPPRTEAFAFARHRRPKITRRPHKSLHLPSFPPSLSLSLSLSPPPRSAALELSWPGPEIHAASSPSPAPYTRLRRPTRCVLLVTSGCGRPPVLLPSRSSRERRAHWARQEERHEEVGFDSQEARYGTSLSERAAGRLAGWAPVTDVLGLPASSPSWQAGCCCWSAWSKPSGRRPCS